MTDTVPALKIAAKAFDHARAAEAALGEVSIYSHTARDFDAARVSLTRCIELLGLISPEPVITVDCGIEPMIEPAPAQPDMAVIDDVGL